VYPETSATPPSRLILSAIERKSRSDSKTSVTSEIRSMKTKLRSFRNESCSA
jgi:hypothetical protein